MYTPEQLEAAGLHDFRVYLALIWYHLNLPHPTDVQYDIADYVQNGPRRRIIQAFRGVGKSWITAAFVTHQLLLSPQKKIMVVSASQLLADQFSTFTKQLLSEVPILQHLNPLPGQRSSNLAFDVALATPDPSPSVKSAGITGMLTGSRADLIVGDDIEIPKNSLSHLLRERLSEAVKEFDAVLKPGGEVVYLGTPQIEASLYNRLLERGYDMRIWPSEIPEKTSVYHRNGINRLAPYVQRMMEDGATPGTPVDPGRFDEEDLAERQASYARTGYALQFLLDTNPSDSDKHPLKLEDLIVMDLDREQAHAKLVWGRGKQLVLNELQPGGFDGDFYHSPAWLSDEMAPYAGVVMSIDPSGEGKDETSYAIVAQLYGNLFLLDCGGFIKGFAPETLDALASRAARWGVNYFVTEKNYGGGMFEQLFRPVAAKVAQATFEEPVWSSGQKEVRIIKDLEPLMNQHRLVVNRSLIEKDWELQRENPQYSLIQQMTRITKDRGALPHEDRLEAVQIACRFWMDRLDVDQSTALEERKQELLDQELEEFHNHVFQIGPSDRNVRWVL